jgi:excisionase family DNA binding protein
MDAANPTKRKKKQKPLQRFYSVEDLTEMFDVVERTVYRWINGRRLRACKAGGQWRISEEDLKAFLEPSDA